MRQDSAVILGPKLLPQARCRGSAFLYIQPRNHARITITAPAIAISFGAVRFQCIEVSSQIMTVQNFFSLEIPLRRKYRTSGSEKLIRIDLLAECRRERPKVSLDCRESQIDMGQRGSPATRKVSDSSQHREANERFWSSPGFSSDPNQKDRSSCSLRCKHCSRFGTTLACSTTTANSADVSDIDEYPRDAIHKLENLRGDHVPREEQTPTQPTGTVQEPLKFHDNSA